MRGSTTTPDVSVVVLSYNVRDLLRSCLRSVVGQLSSGSITHEVIVLDNASADGSAGMVAEEFPDVILLRSETNNYYAAGNNQGVAASRGRLVMILNCDTELLNNAPEVLARFLDEHPRAGACAALLVNPDGTFQKGLIARRFPRLRDHILWMLFAERIWPGNPWTRDFLMLDHDYSRAAQVDQPAGCAIVVRRDVWDRLGGFDENLPIYGNDVDLCWRMKQAGSEIWLVPRARVMHHASRSCRQFSTTVKRRHIMRKSMLYLCRKKGEVWSRMLLTVPFTLQTVVEHALYALALPFSRLRRFMRDEQQDEVW